MAIAGSIEAINDPRRHINTPLGIHRLLKEPYDDKEIFKNMKDLCEYCKNGAWYQGQRVSVMIANPGDIDCYMQDFVISVYDGLAYPIIQTDYARLAYKKISNAWYVLMYYYNPACKHGMLIKEKKTMNYFYDGMAFSMLELINALNPYTTTNDFALVCEYGSPTRGYADPLSVAYLTHYNWDLETLNKNLQAGVPIGIGVSGSVDSYTNLFPVNVGPEIQYLYVEADRYVKAAGGAY